MGSFTDNEDLRSMHRGCSKRLFALEMRQVIFTLVTHGRVFDVGVNIEPNGGTFDASPQNDRASPSVKTPPRVESLRTSRDAASHVTM